MNEKDRVTKAGKAGFFILSLLFPVIGIILFIARRKSKPESARCCRNGVIANIVLLTVMIIGLRVVGIVISNGIDAHIRGLDYTPPEPSNPLSDNLSRLVR